MYHLIVFIGTGAWSGLLPRCPGTWGSLAGLALWALALRRLPPRLLVPGLALFFVVATLCAGSVEKILDRPDPGAVVIDEIFALLLILATLPPRPLLWLAALVLFRLFDILKPWPAGWINTHLHGGLGIMLDDLAAGLYALALLHGFLWWRQGSG